jgi:outer membrane protein assembly factor BamB
VRFDVTVRGAVLVSLAVGCAARAPEHAPTATASATIVDASRRLCHPKARRSIAKSSGGGGGVLEPAWARGDLHTQVAGLDLSAYWARDRLWLFDRRTIARVRAEDGVTEHLDSVEPTGVIAHGGGAVTEGGLIVGTGAEPSKPANLVALDPETRAIVWTAASPSGWEPVSSNGAVLIAGYTVNGGNAPAVWAVRGDSGASLWRRPLEGNGGPGRLIVPGDGCAYGVFGEPGPEPADLVACGVRAFDVGTGEVRWSYRVPNATKAREPCGVAADADMVVLAAPDGALHVLDAVTGTLRVRAPVDGWLSDFYQGFGMLVRAPMAYVLTGSRDDVYGVGPPRALVAIDLDDAGRARWKLPGPISVRTPPVSDDERIYVQTDGGDLRAIALLDGTLEWSWYAGVGVPTAMLVPPEAPRWLIVAGEGERLGGTMGFDLRAPPRGSQVRTRIAGRLVQGRDAFDPGSILVEVADQVVRTDSVGRFSAEVRGEGYAIVDAMTLSVKPRAPMEDPCPMSSVERVPLDGKTHADVRITIEFPECGSE